MSKLREEAYGFLVNVLVVIGLVVVMDWFDKTFFWGH
jgi:hypothetical protein